MSNDFINKKRTHDKELYLQENRYNNIKERDKFVLNLLKEHHPFEQSTSLCDIGCAAGEFIYAVNQFAPNWTLHGYDVVPELIDKAQKMVPSATFQQGSADDPKLCPESKFDISVMMGVLSIFDDYKTIMNHQLSWTAPGGTALIVGAFNPDPVDVWLTYRKEDQAENHRETGWNIFSMSSMSQFLESHPKVESHQFSPFEMPFDLEKDPNDPIRSWTMQDHAGKRILINGLSIIIPMQALLIRLKP